MEMAKSTSGNVSNRFRWQLVRLDIGRQLDYSHGAVPAESVGNDPARLSPRRIAVQH